MIQLISVIIIAVLVAADQLIKMIVVNNLMPVGRIEFIPGILEWNYTENTGAAFSIFDTHTGILSAVTLIIVIAGMIYLLSGRIKGKLNYWALVLILAGGIGNLIDRIFRGGVFFKGYVVDYIKVLFVDFAIFNFADCLVTVGAMIIIVGLIMDLFKDRKSVKDGTE